jgi:hypothetical protein
MDAADGGGSADVMDGQCGLAAVVIANQSVDLMVRFFC